MEQTTVSPSQQTAIPPDITPVPKPARQQVEFSTVCYRNEIPEFVEREMERLYESIYSTVAFYKIYGAGHEGMSTYVVWRNEKIITVFLFRMENGKVTVFNHMVNIRHAEIERFSAYIFSTLEQVAVIIFKAVGIVRRRLPFPCQQYQCTEDIVLKLPDSESAYLASLGRSTRKTVRGYINKTMRNHPSFRYDVYERGDVDEKHIRDIIGFNRARMASKYKESAIDEAEAERIIKLVRQYGLVGVATIDGTVCAGSISCCIGSHYFMLVSAHDATYDALRMGLLCCYLSICDCIARGGRECHFLCGRYDNKYMLQGVQRSLDCMVIYRSRARMLLHAGTALKAAFSAILFQARMWLLYNGNNQKSFFFRVAGKLLLRVRKQRRNRAASSAPAAQPEQTGS
ncbi:MAG: GNAT family N-acetyltransferase [Pseudomonadota bacterium]